jgi:hypothetical protein
LHEDNVESPLLIVSRKNATSSAKSNNHRPHYASNWISTKWGHRSAGPVLPRSLLETQSFGYHLRPTKSRICSVFFLSVGRLNSGPC